MEKLSPVFERIYEDYLKQLADVNLAERAEKLGGRAEDGAAVIPLFGLEHRVSADGIIGPDGRRPPHMVSVVLSKYLLTCPPVEPTGTDWVSYKDFMDASPYVEGFGNTAEKPIAERFSGRVEALGGACAALGAAPAEGDFQYDAAASFRPLPKVPMLLLFSDADEEFPARSVILFERRARSYLDVECLAILGGMLAAFLKQADPEGGVVSA
jgi:hypothetical protein